MPPPPCADVDVDRMLSSMGEVSGLKRNLSVAWDKQDEPVKEVILNWNKYGPTLSVPVYWNCSINSVCVCWNISGMVTQ